MQSITKNTFYQRMVDILINYLPDITGSQLKCLLVIAKMTAGANLYQTPINITQMEKLTGLSRKTVIKTLQELSDYCLISINKDSSTYKYAINRDEFQKMSFEHKPTGRIIESVISKRARVEQLHFQDLEFPPGSKKIFELWNKYIHKWLDSSDKYHMMYVKGSLNTYSVETHINGISQFIQTGGHEDQVFDESFLKFFFNFDGGSHHE